MKIENHMLEIPTFNEEGEVGETIIFDLMIPDQAEEAVELLVSELTAAVIELERRENDDYTKLCN